MSIDGKSVAQHNCWQAPTASFVEEAIPFIGLRESEPTQLNIISGSKTQP